MLPPVLAFVFVTLAVAPERPVEPQSIRVLFENERRVEITPSGMTVVHAPQHHVLVVRVADDGSLVTGCAATEESAEAMLTPKATPLAREK